ncbi:MAG: hypothetical protein ABIQ49_05300 [Gemmatimonadales bacterium]
MRLSGFLLATLALGGPTPARAQAVTSAVAPAAEEWQLRTSTGTLHGTLLAPSGMGKFPVVLIHPGSGPTDRDGNSPLLYLISWFRILPADAVARLNMPVLVVQGTTDLQVDTAEAARLLARRSDARYLQVKGMNHVLKLVAGELADQAASYGDSTLMVAPALLDGLADFVRSLPTSDGKSAR